MAEGPTKTIRELLLSGELRPERKLFPHGLKQGVFWPEVREAIDPKAWEAQQAAALVARRAAEKVLPTRDVLGQRLFMSPPGEGRLPKPWAPGTAKPVTRVGVSGPVTALRLEEKGRWAEGLVQRIYGKKGVFSSGLPQGNPYRIVLGRLERFLGKGSGVMLDATEPVRTEVLSAEQGRVRTAPGTSFFWSKKTGKPILKFQVLRPKRIRLSELDIPPSPPMVAAPELTAPQIVQRQVFPGGSALVRAETDPELARELQEAFDRATYEQDVLLPPDPEEVKTRGKRAKPKRRRARSAGASRRAVVAEAVRRKGLVIGPDFEPLPPEKVDFRKIYQAYDLATPQQLGLEVRIATSLLNAKPAGKHLPLKQRIRGLGQGATLEEAIRLATPKEIDQVMINLAGTKYGIATRMSSTPTPPEVIAAGRKIVEKNVPTGTLARLFQGHDSAMRNMLTAQIDSARRLKELSALAAAARLKHRVKRWERKPDVVTTEVEIGKSVRRGLQGDDVFEPIEVTRTRRTAKALREPPLIDLMDSGDAKRGLVLDLERVGLGKEVTPGEVIRFTEQQTGWKPTKILRGKVPKSLAQLVGLVAVNVLAFGAAAKTADVIRKAKSVGPKIPTVWR